MRKLLQANTTHNFSHTKGWVLHSTLGQFSRKLVYGHVNSFKYLQHRWSSWFMSENFNTQLECWSQKKCCNSQAYYWGNVFFQSNYLHMNASWQRKWDSQLQALFLMSFSKEGKTKATIYQMLVQETEIVSNTCTVKCCRACNWWIW